MDQLLETFLSCNTAHELIDKQLNICCEDITGGVPTGGVKYADILGKMFSMVYISRNGLKYDEIWDMVKMFSVQNPPDESMKEKLFSILFSFTMVVKENHSFSHEIYREVSDPPLSSPSPYILPPFMNHSFSHEIYREVSDPPSGPHHIHITPIINPLP